MKSKILDLNLVITNGYKKGIHEGVDCVGKNGKGKVTCNILAISKGKIVSLRNDYQKTDKTGNSYGNYIKLQHDNGMYSLYAHLKYGTIKKRVGDNVSEGEIIGFMGSTGHAKGAHLHFEIRNKDNKKINPLSYIKKGFEVGKEDLSSSEDLLFLVKRTIRGDFGNGKNRKNILKENYDIVQKQVNLNFKNKTTNWDEIKWYSGINEKI